MSSTLGASTGEVARPSAALETQSSEGTIGQQETFAAAEPGVAPRVNDGGRSRLTAAVRLILAIWLIRAGLAAFADPAGTAEARATPVAVLLPLSGLSFTIGFFFLTGFMTRVGGLLLAGMSLWELMNLGFRPLSLVMAVTGLYLMLRGGGTWAMDVYVQKMQDRVRRREAAERAAGLRK